MSDTGKVYRYTAKVIAKNDNSKTLWTGGRELTGPKDVAGVQAHKAMKADGFEFNRDKHTLKLNRE